jgi:hypothetical protein
MASVYKIGTTYGNMKTIGSLSTNAKDKDPRGEPMEYSRPVKLGDGSTRNLGVLTQTWHWDFMTETLRNALYNYIGDVYVYTRNNAGSFAYYTAKLIWPENEPEHYANRVLDVSLQLWGLETYTP